MLLAVLVVVTPVMTPVILFLSVEGECVEERPVVPGPAVQA